VVELNDRSKLCSESNRCLEQVATNHNSKSEETAPQSGCAIRVVWFSYQPTPYNDVLFRHLAASQHLSLRVVYRASVLSSHPWKTTLGTGYAHRYYRQIFGIDFRSILQAFDRQTDCFVVAGWDHPTTFVLLTLLRVMARRYMIWTDTPLLVGRRRTAFVRWARQHWLQWLFEGSQACFSTGKEGVSRLRDMGVPSDKAHNLPFVLNIDEYPDWCHLRCKFGSTTKLRFMSSGRLSNPVKGYDLAIRALAHALGASDGWEYTIAGSGPDQGALEELATSLGVGANVRFLGWVEPSDLKDELSKSHAFIHPSPRHDPYPNAVLEAMAAGCVVFASNACGSALDRISHGDSGFIHRHGDWLHLANQIAHLRSIVPEIEPIARRARGTAEYWSIDRSLRSLMNVISGADQCAD
jgi:glycosyltransferase involved in cell wall biosynthesis